MISDKLNEIVQLVGYHEFYSDAAELCMDVKEDFLRWKVKEEFSFCEYPFLLSTSMKGEILRHESQIGMRHELQDTFFRAIFEGIGNPYLQLEIRRDYIMRDTLFQLQSRTKPYEFRKQLRVIFAGEG